jgi:hypothetical protein
MSHITGTKTEIEDIQTAEDEVSGYPIIGHHVGMGRHCEMDPLDPTSPGWTIHGKGIRKHPIRDEYAYPYHSSLAEKLAGKLPQQALDNMQSEILTSDWFETEE